MQEPQILDKPALTVIGMHRSFLHALSPESNTKQVIGGLWHEFPQRASSVPHRAGHTMYGIIYGLPEEERSHPHQLEYIAAVPVSSTAQIPDGMIPDGMVARRADGKVLKGDHYRAPDVGAVLRSQGWNAGER